MIDVPLGLVAKDDLNEAPPSASAGIDTLSRALSGKAVPSRPTRAKGEMASSDEGLELVRSFIAIQDPHVRQAILHAAATLAASEHC